MRWLALATLGSVLAPGCCCDSGADRLATVEIADERGTSIPVAFDSTVVDLPVSGFFRVFLFGGPGDGRLTTTPTLELYDVAGTPVAMARFTDANDGGCADAEIFDPDGLIAGQTYSLVHRSSSSPGDLEDSGEPEGSLRGRTTDFRGEPALVANIRVVEDPAPSASTGSADGTGGSSSASASGGGAGEDGAAGRSGE